MNEMLILEFLNNMRACEGCPGCEEGCAVCGQWYPYPNHPNGVSEYHAAHDIYNTICDVANMATNEHWMVVGYNLQFVTINMVDTNSFNGICHYEYAEGDDLYFFCRIGG